VVREQGYRLHDDDPLGLVELRATALRGTRPATLVSLGPGDGKTDVQLVRALRGAGETVGYVPADLSDVLLTCAVNEVAPHASIPAAVMCGWEGSSEFLCEVLGKRAERPWLISLLGGTIGNLDHGVGAFLERWRALLSPGDRLLVDVPLLGPTWRPETEPRVRLAQISPAFRRFLAGGLVCRCPELSIDALVENFAARVRTTVRADEELGTPFIQLYETESRQVLLQLRRFEWRSWLARALAAGFTIEYAQQSRMVPDMSFSMGVVLLGLPPVAKARGARGSAANQHERAQTAPTDIWSKQLDLQTRFDIYPELPVLLRSAPLAEASRILILGRGGSEYLLKLARAYPEKSCTALERTEPGRDLGTFDFVFARVVVQHARSVDEFLRSAADLVAPGGTLVVQDARDEMTFLLPGVDIRGTLLRSMDRAQRAGGAVGRRAVGAVEARCQRFGFTWVRSEDLVQRATTRRRKALLRDLFAHTYHWAENELGADVDVARGKAQLRRWFLRERSYGQVATRICFLRAS
jgi:SAM-dependent methyltransferase